jgi:hypothetical protein
MTQETVGPGPAFNDELSRLAKTWAPPGRASDFLMDVTKVVISAIQAGRAAAQGAQGIVVCGKCGKVVHQCEHW